MVQGLTTELALPGDVLVEEGKLSRGLFFIMRGAVSVLGTKPTLTAAQRAGIKRKFDSFDADGSGSIDASELREAMLMLGLELSKREAKRMINEIDADGSGQIEFEEFMELLLDHNSFREVFGLAPQESEELSEGFFGEESVLTGFPSSVTVKAAKYSDFFLLPSAVFNVVLEKNENMRQLVLEYTNKRAAQRAAKMKKQVNPSPLTKKLGASGHWRRIRVGAAFVAGGQKGKGPSPSGPQSRLSVVAEV